MAAESGENGGMEECAPASSVEVNSWSARNGGAIFKVCAIHDVGFYYVPDSCENRTGLWLEGDGHLFCTNLPYNVGSIRNGSNSDYDVFSNPDKENMVHLIWDVLGKGGHRQIFSSELQFRFWYQKFRKVTESVQSGDKNDTEAATRFLALLEVQKGCTEVYLSSWTQQREPGFNKTTPQECL